MWRLLIVALVLVAACSSSDDPVPATTSSAIPRPTDEQALYIGSDVADAYPGVPDGKAAEWARNVCLDQRSGNTDAQLEAYIVQRFAGGDRPDPTQEQARAILAAIRASGYCP